MPSWYQLGENNLSDMLSLIESWRLTAYSPAVQKFIAGDEKSGEQQFHYLCSRCHGEFGEGETGPAILNKSFLRAADEEFLYHTIASGRAHTAMFGWSTQLTGAQQLKQTDINNIISYIFFR